MVLLKVLWKWTKKYFFFWKVFAKKTFCDNHKKKKPDIQCRIFFCVYGHPLLPTVHDSPLVILTLGYIHSTVNGPPVLLVGHETLAEVVVLISLYATQLLLPAFTNPAGQT